MIVWRPISAARFCAALLVACASASAEQLLVRTDATTAHGDVVRSDAVIVDVEKESYSGALVSLAAWGETMIAHGVLGPQTYTWSTRSGAAGSGRLEFHELPLLRKSASRIRKLRVDGAAALLESDPAHETVVALYLRSGVATLLVKRQSESLFDSTPVLLQLPGRPVDIAYLDGADRLAVLCQNDDGTVRVLVVRSDSAKGERPVSRWIPVAAHQFNFEAARILPVGDGVGVFVLGSGYNLNRADGQPVTWLYRLQLDGSKKVEVLELPGAPPSPESTLLSAGAQRCWVVTQTPDADSATASLIRTDRKGLVVETRISLPSARGSIGAAVSPEFDSVLFATGSRLQHWSNRGALLATREFPAQIGVIAWPQDRIYLGEGGRVHRLSPADLATERSIQLHAGRIAELHLLPMELRALGDADADRIFDPIDPDPNTATPNPAVPGRIVLREEAAGSELRTFLVASEHASNARWRLEVRAGGLPGLHLYPSEGVFPGVVYAALDPSFWPGPPGKNSRTVVDLIVEDQRTSALLRSIEIEIEVKTRTERVPRILWIPAASRPEDDRTLPPVLESLQAPPHYFSLETSQIPNPSTLGRYTVIVVSLEAAIGGQISRFSLENFAASGGGVLLLGEAGLEPRLDDINEWLSPFRMNLRPAREAVRTVRAQDHCDICRAWSDASLGKALLARGEPPAEVHLMPTRESAEGPLVTVPYGLGRVAFLASEGLLHTSDANPSVRRIVEETILWLARARSEVEDRDGDGLADSIEDRNGNGQLDAGESDPLNPDTDGDLLPDGAEDFNRNGMLDDGETNPLVYDTDGDHIADAADAHPVAPIGSPHILSLTPPEALAEGGIEVRITGRNFRGDSMIFFTRRMARVIDRPGSESVVVELPPHPNRNGGTVDVRVINAGDRLEGVLPGGFHYRPQPDLKLTLRNLRFVDTLYEISPGNFEDTVPDVTANLRSQAGTLEVRVDGASLPLSRVRFYLDTGAAVLEAKPASSSRKSTVNVRRSPGGESWEIDIRVPPEARPAKPLATLYWRGSGRTPITFSPRNGAARAHNGASYTVAGDPLSVAPP